MNNSRNRICNWVTKSWRRGGGETRRFTPILITPPCHFTPASNQRRNRLNGNPITMVNRIFLALPSLTLRGFCAFREWRCARDTRLDAAVCACRTKVFNKTRIDGVCESAVATRRAATLARAIKPRGYSFDSRLFFQRRSEEKRNEWPK